MFAHLEILQYFRIFQDIQKENVNQSKIQNIAQKIEQIYEKSTNKVKYQNLQLLRQIYAKGYASEYENSNNINSAMIQQKKQSCSISSCFSAKGIKYTSQWMFSIEQNIKSKLKRIWLQNYIKSLQIKQSCLLGLCNKYPKIMNLMKNSDQNKKLRSYLRFFEGAKIFYLTGVTGQNIGQIGNVDLLDHIRVSNIDYSNVNRFTVLFTNLNQVNFGHLNSNVETVIKIKGEQYLNYLEEREILLESELEYKGVCYILNKLELGNQRMENVVSKDKELVGMVKQVSFQGLNLLNFVDSNMKVLEDAKEFAIENDLHFRIGKIMYMIKLFEFKIEVLNYLPAKYVVKCPQNLPIKYQNICVKKSLDFFVLRKLNQKIKLLKFPQNDYVFESIEMLLKSKTQYFSTLSSIISTYNMNISSNYSHIKFPKYDKNTVLNMIKANQNDFITCLPEQQQILNIISIHDQFIYEFKEMNKNRNFNQKDLIKMYNSIEQLPFQFENKLELQSIFCEIHMQVKKSEENQDSVPEIMDNNSNRKGELDETSAKMDYSNRSLGLISLIEQIKSKPRVFSYDEIHMKIKKICNQTNVQNSDLDEIFMGFRNVSIETEIIEKFRTGEKISQEELALAKKMVADYQKQFIRIDDIQSVENQIKMKEQVSSKGTRRRSRIIKQNDASQNSSGSVSLSSSSLASNKSTRNDEQEPKYRKKNKYCLNK